MIPQKLQTLSLPRGRESADIITDTGFPLSSRGNDNKEDFSSFYAPVKFHNK
jgi:hypothetical protein